MIQKLSVSNSSLVELHQFNQVTSGLFSSDPIKNLFIQASKLCFQSQSMSNSRYTSKTKKGQCFCGQTTDLRGEIQFWFLSLPETCVTFSQLLRLCFGKPRSTYHLGADAYVFLFTSVGLPVYFQLDLHLSIFLNQAFNLLEPLFPYEKQG